MKNLTGMMKQAQKLQAKMMEMQMRLPPPEPKWVVRLREKLAGK